MATKGVRGKAKGIKDGIIGPGRTGASLEFEFEMALLQLL